MKLALSTNAVLAMIIGAVSIAWGVWGVIVRFSDYFSYGFIFFGIGFVLMGLTNGFSDQTPTGRIFVKLGILILLAGTAILGYYFIKLI